MRFVEDKMRFCAKRKAAGGDRQNARERISECLRYDRCSSWACCYCVRRDGWLVPTCAFVITKICEGAWRQEVWRVRYDSYVAYALRERPVCVHVGAYSTCIIVGALPIDSVFSACSRKDRLHSAKILAQNVASMQIRHRELCALAPILKTKSKVAIEIKAIG